MEVGKEHESADACGDDDDFNLSSAAAGVSVKSVAVALLPTQRPGPGPSGALQQAGVVGGAAASRDFNYSRKIAEEASDALGLSAGLALQKSFHFRVVEKNLQGTHYQHGQGMRLLKYDCIVAGMQEVMAPDGPDPDHKYLIPQGMPQMCRLHLWCSGSDSLQQPCRLRVWPAPTALPGVPVLQTSRRKALNAVEWICSRSSLSSTSCTVPEGTRPELAEVLVLLQGQGWRFVRADEHACPTTSLDDSIIARERVLRLRRNELPSCLSLACILWSSRLFQLGLNNLRLYENNQYYLVLLRVLELDGMDATADTATEYRAALQMMRGLKAGLKASQYKGMLRSLRQPEAVLDKAFHDVHDMEAEEGIPGCGVDNSYQSYSPTKQMHDKKSHRITVAAQPLSSYCSASVVSEIPVQATLQHVTGRSLLFLQCQLNSRYKIFANDQH